MRIGILTGGGDCPGLNAVIRAVVRSATQHGDEVIGFRDGWGGVLDNSTMVLDFKSVVGIVHRGGTILGTSRRSALEDRELVAERFAEHRLDCLIAIGGNGTLYAADEFSKTLPIIGVPKTIDNDLSGTDRTFGFDTAVQIATDAMDRLRTTGDSHHRCMVAEVMGRHVGWIALHSGMAAGAHAILIPEQKVNIDQICEWVQSAYDRGRAPLIAVAEGFRC